MISFIVDFIFLFCLIDDGHFCYLNTVFIDIFIYFYMSYLNQKK